MTSWECFGPLFRSCTLYVSICTGSNDEVGKAAIEFSEITLETKSNTISATDSNRDHDIDLG